MSPAPRPPIETVFWDLGGVILSNGWDHTQRTRVLSHLGIDLAAYEAAHERENWFWERGLITAREFFTRTVLAPNPHLTLTYDQLWPLVCAESSLAFPDTFAILRHMRGLPDFRLATLNNESPELNAFRLDHFGLRGCFDFFVCSGYVHEMKPAPAIYRDAIAISGRPAGTALFIDDKQENCDAARALGMQAIHFESAAQLAADLPSYGIKLHG